MSPDGDPRDDAPSQTAPDGASVLAPELGTGDLAAQDTLAPAESPAPPSWEMLSETRRVAVLEAVLFAAERPLAMSDLRELLGASRADITPALDALRRDLRRPERGLVLAEVGGGLAFRTRSDLSPWLRPLVQSRPPRLSRAALETLAIIAYRQPVTRAEVEEVRGVDSGGVVRSLLDKRLIRILGRRNDVGRPMIYGTTRDFLQTFNLKDLSALPPLAEVRELMEGKVPHAERPAPPLPVGPRRVVLDVPGAPAEDAPPGEPEEG